LRHWDTGRALGVGLYIIGAGAFIWGAGIDISYWVGQSASTEGALAYAGGSVLFQAAVLIFAAVTGYLLFQGAWWQKLMSIPACAVLLFFLSYNMLGVMSFQAKERVMPVKQAQELRQAAIDAQLEAENRQNQRQNEAINTLRDDALAATTAIRRAPTKQARAAAIDMKREADSAYAAAAFATVTAVAPVEAPKVIDPQAEFIAMFVPYTVEQIQLVMTAWWGIGLQALKVLCWFFAPALTRRVAIVNVEKESALPSAPPVEAPAEIEASRVTRYAVPQPHKAERPEPVSATVTPIRAHVSTLERVKEWRDEATKPCSGAKIAATPMHQHFMAWCASKGYPGLNSQLFGSHCTALGFVRDPASQSRRSGTHYLNVGLCPLGEEGQLTIAA
jgi:hypothetical protein